MEERTFESVNAEWDKARELSARINDNYRKLYGAMKNGPYFSVLKEMTRDIRKLSQNSDFHWLVYESVDQSKW